MNTLFIGVDVSKDTIDVCQLGSKLKPCHEQFPNEAQGFEAMMDWLKVPQAPASLLIGMEVTGRYHEALADFALARGLKVFVLNPIRIKSYRKALMKRHKNDKQDSWLIAKFIKTHADDMHPYQPPSSLLRDLKELTRRMDQLTKQITVESNRLGHLPKTSPARSTHQRMLNFLTSEQKELATEIDRLIAQDEALETNVKLLLEIPQCGRKLAWVFLAETGSIEVFSSTKELTAWAGLVPCDDRSGKGENPERICRKGNKRIRRHLYMASLGAMKSTNVWAPWVQVRRDNQKTGKKLVVAFMDKLLRVMWGVVKTQTPFDLQLALGSNAQS